ncbi:MAG: molybdenum cofactor guanylyltransferase [Synechococcus sp.]|nr:molybdenum cofactor guanylyltransferase [Synechococcus sp.]
MPIDLKACVLSGGGSRRMGRDKALLPHPSGGVWLSALVNQLRALALPVVVVSGHSAHHQLLRGRAGVDLLVEEPAGLGPLHAFGQLVAAEPQQAAWLVVPVDMPLISAALLERLIQAWSLDPGQAAVADDGQRLQPLLGIYPASEVFASTLREQLSQGDRRWLHWLERIPYRAVLLPADQLRNVNAVSDLAPLSDAR